MAKPGHTERFQRKQEDLRAIAVVQSLRHRTGPVANCRCEECLCLKRVLHLARIGADHVNG